MNTYTLNGGYSYAGGIEVEAESIESAAAEWFDRWSSNGNRRVAGVYWPVFGDMEDTDYAVINYDTEEALTYLEVLSLFGETPEKYTVWVGGIADVEGVDYAEAQEVHAEWVEKGYDDVIIEAE